MQALLEQEKSLRMRKQLLQGEVQQKRREAALLKSSDRDKALQCLRKSKIVEQQLILCDGLLLRLESTRLALESARG